MAQWVAAFVGKSARENYETTLVNGDFWVSSNRTPIRKLRPGDRLLLYMAGEGFVGQAVAFSSAFSYEGRVKSSGKTPVLGVALREIRTFASPIHYKFPEKGPHPALGFHRYALTGGFTTLSREGLQEVLCRAAEQSSPTNELRFGEPGTEARHRTTEIPESNPQTTAKRNDKQPESKPREKRQARQHAVNKGLKGIDLWTVAETVTPAVGWKSVQKKAREKAFNAKNTWLKGAKPRRGSGWSWRICGSTASTSSTTYSCWERAM